MSAHAASWRIGDQSPHYGHRGHAASHRIRKPIEETFGSMKTIGCMRRPMLRGTDRVGWSLTFVAAAFNLVRLPKLLAA